MLQSFDGVDSIRDRKKLDNLMIRDLITAFPVTSEPVKSSAEFSSVEPDEPAVHDLRKRARLPHLSTRLLDFRSKTWSFDALFRDFVPELCSHVPIPREDTPVVLGELGAIGPDRPINWKGVRKRENRFPFRNILNILQPGGRDGS